MFFRLSCFLSVYKEHPNLFVVVRYQIVILQSYHQDDYCSNSSGYNNWYSNWDIMGLILQQIYWSSKTDQTSNPNQNRHPIIQEEAQVKGSPQSPTQDDWKKRGLAEIKKEVFSHTNQQWPQTCYWKNLQGTWHHLEAHKLFYIQWL